MQLQQQVDDAQQRLKLTQSRVDQNLQRISELKAEAMALEALSISTDAAVTTVEATSQPALAAAAAAATNYANAPAVTQTKVRQSSETDQSKSGTSVTSPTMHSSTGRAAVRDRGLSSSLEAEEGLRNFWYPAEFSKSLTENTMVPFELFDEPWVLFRDEHGSPACIRDECAHRACPLSLGKVVDGQVQCAYHGWQFNADGACTKMPSTVHCRHVGVSALPCVEKHGFIWVWPGDGVPNEVSYSACSACSACLLVVAQRHPCLHVKMYRADQAVADAVILPVVCYYWCAQHSRSNMCCLACVHGLWYHYSPTCMQGIGVSSSSPSCL